MIDLFLVIYLILIFIVIYSCVETSANKDKNYKKAKLISDFEYLEREKERTAVSQREINKNIRDMFERLTRVEESAKQAHKRIDKVEENR